MAPGNEFGLSSLPVDEEVLLVKLFVQDARRVQLQKILDSLLSECERAEANGLKLWDWEISVTPRQPTKEKRDD